MSARDTARRTCECGCGTSLDGRHPDARFHNAACRARAWKVNNDYRARRNAGNARANGRKRPASVRISYRKALTALTVELGRLNVPDPERRARGILDPLLTDRQRETLRA